MDNSNRPDLRAYIGATGSGKGVSIREHLKAAKPKRLIVWDPLGEYSQFCKIVTKSMPEAIAAMKHPAFTVAYMPSGDPKGFAGQFDLWCRAAFAAGNCTALVEELADVTKASHAPTSWRRLTTQGRHAGLKIIGASQRPAQVDKNFLGGCTYIRCFTLRYEEDRKAMKSAMKVTQDQIDALETVETATHTVINCLEKDFRTNTLSTKVIKLSRKSH